jgi:predicted RNase H-like HicB family nuclease
MEQSDQHYFLSKEAPTSNPMDLHTPSPTSADITLHILLEQQTNGRILAQVPALPNCTLERSTREEALEAIQQLLSEKLATVEVLPVHISPTPTSSETSSWKPFLGMFKDDSYFAEIADELWAKRQTDDEEEISIDWIEPQA